MRYALIAATFCISATAQISDLAVSDDGQTILFRSGFRLQIETDLGTQGKIYRYQNGQWTRLAAALDYGIAVSPPDVYQPFLTSDPNIYGWQINIGCILCQLQIGPYESSQVAGVNLPAFPHSNLRISRNARYLIADSIPFGGPMYLDSVTGAITDVPVFQYAPVIRQVANDGTAVILVTSADDLFQEKVPGVLSLWRPGVDPRPLYSETFVSGVSLSAMGGMLALESVAQLGADGGERKLLVINTQTGERMTVATMPSGMFSASYLSQASWDASGANLIYRAFDDRGQPSSIALWNSMTRETRTLVSSSEGFASAAISGDGRVAWAVTQSNRLLRIDAASGAAAEILPPLGAVFGVDEQGVPGSAVFIRGKGFTKDQQALDGATVLPQVDVTAEGYWAQIPWEYNNQPTVPRTVTLRAPNNPFETLAHISIRSFLGPQFAVNADGRVKAVHQDFSSLVTPDNPAHPVETVHVYMIGLGLLDQPLATGQPGPSAPPAKPLATVACDLGKPPTLNVPFVAYAAGLIGIYQVDVTMPDTLADAMPQLRCFVGGVLAAGPFVTSSR
jgi:uncharacterized protein (TIGR03437 family)